MVVPFIQTIFLAQNYRKTIWFITAAIILFLPSSYHEALDEIQRHEYISKVSQNSEEYINDLKKLTAALKKDRSIILVSKTIHKRLENYNFFLNLPVKTDNNQPIRYTMNYFAPDYVLHNRAKINYLITTEKLTTISGRPLNQISQTNSYLLYEIL